MRRDEPIEVPDSVQDASKWERCQCPTCGATAESRWIGLRDVAATGDENAATRQYRHPVFTSPNDGPFIVRQEVVLPGDRTRFVAIDPSTGITPGYNEFEEQAASVRQALNAAYWLGVSHESHKAGAVVRAATELYLHPDSDSAKSDLSLAVRQYHNGEEP